MRACRRWSWLPVLLLPIVPLVACAAPAAAPAAPGAAGGGQGASPAAAPAAGQAAPPAPVHLKAAWFTVGGQSAPLWVAQDAGLFQKHGLDVELVFIEGATLAVQSAVSGEVPIITTGSPAIVNARLEGADLFDVAHYVPTLPYVLIANPRIRSGADLKGGRGATARRGGASDVAFHLALRKLGVNPDTDLTVIEIGAQQSRFAALQAGSVDATVVDDAFGEEAERLGFPILADVRDVQFPFVSVGVGGRYLREQPETVRAFMRAFVEAIHFFKTHRAESERILARWMKTDNQALVQDTWEAYATRYLASKPYPTVEGARAMLEFAAERNPRAATADPRDFIYPQILEDLEREGFFERLGR
ncbi:MAG TPA: ABC transporter substrate-binding protein [Chloroflexota bacterium]|jgi:NitT/TauT family transport system substrate-binding protein|nr:ABC transporter substrate-binding protein [Chloroflexota bacterium]